MKDLLKLVELSGGNVEELLDFIPAGILVVDKYGKFRFVNKLAEKICGYKNRELSGKHFKIQSFNNFI